MLDIIKESISTSTDKSALKKAILEINKINFMQLNFSGRTELIETRNLLKERLVKLESE